MLLPDERLSFLRELTYQTRSLVMGPFSQPIRVVWNWCMSPNFHIGAEARVWHSEKKPVGFGIRP